MTKLAPRHGSALVSYAKSQVGKSYPVGYCQKFTNETFATGGVGDWDGDHAADAEDGWKKAVAKGKVVQPSKIKSLNDIPASGMRYWTGGSHDNGHAAIGIGGGKMVSTDLPVSGKIGEVGIDQPHSKWGLTFAGYATMDGNGYDPGSYLPVKKTGALYTVATRAGLYARTSANGKNKIVNGKKLVRPYGFTVRVVSIVSAGGVSGPRVRVACTTP